MKRFSSRHCEEPFDARLRASLRAGGDEAIQAGLLRFARNDTAGVVIQSKPTMP
jgi:hypothetical protein